MRVLHVVSEIYPLIKTGGLADVVGALPIFLGELGVDVRVLVPAYGGMLDKVERGRDLGEIEGARLWEGVISSSGIKLFLLEAPGLYEREGGPYQDKDGKDWGDNHLRFGLLSRVGALLALGWLKDWRPDILNGHDWQAGLAAAYLHAWGREDFPSLLTIHNIAYGGLFAPEKLAELRLPESMYSMHGLEFYGNIGFLKAGCYYSRKLSTVSPTYAKEIQGPEHGCGLQGLLAARHDDLYGILNGVDYHEWNPETDKHLYFQFPPGNMLGKWVNKVMLQQEFGLNEGIQIPLLTMISRLNWHKGSDLILAVLPEFLDQGIEVALIGSGDKGLENAFRKLKEDYPKQVALHIGYAEELAHRFMAAGDIFLMPSRSEPCGLTQLYALRYGAVPLASQTGGLADTINAENGFPMPSIDAEGLRATIRKSLHSFKDKQSWNQRVGANSQQDFGWGRQALEYLKLYKSML